MGRRAFIGTLAVLAAPRAAEAQPAAKVYRIGVISSGGREQERVLQAALRERLRERGWVEGQNLVVEWRYAEGQYDRAPQLVVELGRPQAGSPHDTRRAGDYGRQARDGHDSHRDVGHHRSGRHRSRGQPCPARRQRHGALRRSGPGDHGEAAATAETGCHALPDDLAVRALHGWLDFWRGIGDIERGMARQDFDLQLTRYADEAWRATFFVKAREHSMTSACGSAREPTAWRAVQVAARETLRKALEQQRTA
jgi:hypothetical protein